MLQSKKRTVLHLTVRSVTRKTNAFSLLFYNAKVKSCLGIFFSSEGFLYITSSTHILWTGKGNTCFFKWWTRGNLRRCRYLYFGPSAIFSSQERIMRYLDGTTRILVAHELQFLKETDTIILLDDVSIILLAYFIYTSDIQ